MTIEEIEQMINDRPYYDAVEEKLNELLAYDEMINDAIVEGLLPNTGFLKDICNKIDFFVNSLRVCLKHGLVGFYSLINLIKLELISALELFVISTLSQGFKLKYKVKYAN